MSDEEEVLDDEATTSTDDDITTDEDQEGQITEDELTVDERAELEALRKKDFNFKKMRSVTKQGREEIKKGKEELDSGWKEFRENIIKERESDALELLVGDDEEKRKKVLYNYNRIDKDKPAVTKEEIYKRMREAANMEGVSSSPNIISKGGHSGYRGTTSVQESPESQKMRKEFKITDEQKSKYSSPDWTPKF